MLCCPTRSPSQATTQDAAWSNDVELGAREFGTQAPHTALSGVSQRCSKASGALGGAVGACADAVQIAAARPVRSLVGLVGLGVVATSLTFLVDADRLDPGDAVERGLEQFALGVVGVVGGVLTTACAVLRN